MHFFEMYIFNGYAWGFGGVVSFFVFRELKELFPFRWIILLSLRIIFVYFAR